MRIFDDPTQLLPDLVRFKVLLEQRRVGASSQEDDAAIEALLGRFAKMLYRYANQKSNWVLCTLLKKYMHYLADEYRTNTGGNMAGDDILPMVIGQLQTVLKSQMHIVSPMLAQLNELEDYKLLSVENEAVLYMLVTLNASFQHLHGHRPSRSVIGRFFKQRNLVEAESIGQSSDELMFTEQTDNFGFLFDVEEEEIELGDWEAGYPRDKSA